jgi:hypothetical protein
MKKLPDITAACGNTPLVFLEKASKASGADIYGKLEYFNPLSSVKDRIGLAMINDKPPSNGGTGMDINACDAVGLLGHDPRQLRYLEFVEPVGNPIHHRGIQPGIGKNDFIMAFGCRVARIGPFDIPGQFQTQVRDGLDHGQSGIMPPGFAFRAGQVIPVAVMAKHMNDLFR